MEAMQFRWFHWQWNHNETEGLRGFTVRAVDSSQTSHALKLKDHKVYRKDGAVEKMYLCFNETFVKRRKLQVDPSESVWYMVKGQSETLAHVSAMGLQRMHS